MKLTNKILILVESWKDIPLNVSVFKELKQPTKYSGSSVVDVDYEGFKIKATISSYSVAGKWGKGSNKKYSWTYIIKKDGKEYKPPTSLISNKTELLNSIKKAISRFNKKGEF